MQTIVVSLPGCPTACWGIYGNEFSATPHLDRLAVDGIAFDNHFSDKPDPVSARIAWRTGLGSSHADLIDTVFEAALQWRLTDTAGRVLALGNTTARLCRLCFSAAYNEKLEP